MIRFKLILLSADPTKFFGCELGAQTQFDSKNDRYIVNGSHTGEKLQTLLDGFIKKFVLCPECSNPETNLVSYTLINLELSLMVFETVLYIAGTVSFINIPRN